MNLKHFVLAVSAALVAAGAACLSSPSAEAAGGRPRFDFAAGEMTVAITGHGRDAANYYMSYTISNPMEAARTPRLYIEVKTDTGQTFGDRPDSKVLDAASKALKAPDLKSTADLRAQEMASGASAQAIANFGNIDPNADEMTVRVYGLWDPIVRTRQGKVFNEKRVLVLQFGRKGDEYDRPMDPIKLKSRKEEIEGDPVELYSTTAEKKK